jgi:flagellin-like hook-associated protein FlgL
MAIMAISYAGESAANQALIDNWANNLRAQLGELGRVQNRIEQIRGQYAEEIAPLLSAWDALEEVPNKSGLAGSSVSETHEQMETWESYLDTFNTNLGDAAHMSQYTSAAGPSNILG